jgi:hypothetical protein
VSDVLSPRIKHVRHVRFAGRRRGRSRQITPAPARGAQPPRKQVKRSATWMAFGALSRVSTAASLDRTRIGSTVEIKWGP